MTTKRGNIDRFSGGQAAMQTKLNQLVHTVNFLLRQNKIDIIPRVRATSGIYKAYCKTAAGSGSTIVCYLGTDGTGEEVTVTCTLIQASNLSSCFPTLADGTMMPVWRDGDTWRSLWWFQGNEECG
jgi:hypothetical protein